MFKQLVTLGVIVCVGFVACPATALMLPPVPQRNVIQCLGTESGGGGVRQYEYEVWNNELNTPFSSLWVGTDDTNLANYTNWLLPPNWQLGLDLTWGMPDTPGVKTPHGQVAPSPTGTTAAVIHFWTGPLGQPIQPGQIALFGFDNPHASQNVDWYPTPPWPAIGANWNSPVGTGAFAAPNTAWTDGPVHGPVPEPSALGLLVIGAAAAVRRRRC